MAEISRTERVLGPLKVGVRADLQVTRQLTRGGPRYVVHDPISFQNQALGASDYAILTAIVQHRTLAATYQELVDRGELGAGEQDRQGFYKLVLWLHGAGLLHLPITGGDVLWDRYRKKQASRRGPWYQCLMSQRVPVWNPDAFLQRTLGAVGWLFGAPGLLVWLALMATVAWKCVGRFDELFAESHQLLALGNLPLLWFAMVALKVLHEFGHAYACRRYGGPVPEMGVQMVVLTPCAYVDASSSWKLLGARQRVVVALAGMYVESFVAGVGALVWAGTQPGLTHDLAFNVVALAGVVTVLFNLNPLMKYDGYFVFSDLLGVFNLQQRASGFLRGWVGHLALGLPRPRTVYSRGERWLYGLYGPAAFAYRVVLAFTLTGFVMLQWPGAGLFLGAVFGWGLVLRPLWSLLRFLWSSAETAASRTRSRLVAVSTFVIAPLLLGFVPVSWSVTAPGVLDPSTRESVRAPAGGFVADLHATNGSRVQPDDVLCTLRNPELEMRRTRLLGELDAESVSLDAVELADTTQAAIHRARLTYLRASVREIDQRLASMTLRAQVQGTVASGEDLDLQGRFLQQGEELFQIQSGHRFLRVVLTEEDVARTRLEVGSTAEVRWACDPSSPTRAVVREIRDAASRYEVPTTLTKLGGGDVFVRPHGNGTEADQPYLHVLLEVDAVPLQGQGTGLTARVRLPARVQLLGAWVQHRLLSFANAWRMS